jgi:hypothetical protein
VLLVVLEQTVRVRGEPEEVVVLREELDRDLVDRAELTGQEVGLVVVELARHAVEALVVTEVDVVPAVLVDGQQDLPDRLLVPRLRGPDVVVVAMSSRAQTSRHFGSMASTHSCGVTPAASAARCSFRPCSSVPVRWKTSSPRSRW